MWWQRAHINLIAQSINTPRPTPPKHSKHIQGTRCRGSWGTTSRLARYTAPPWGMTLGRNIALLVDSLPQCSIHKCLLHQLMANTSPIGRGVWLLLYSSCTLCITSPSRSRTLSGPSSESPASESAPFSGRGGKPRLIPQVPSHALGSSPHRRCVLAKIFIYLFKILCNLHDNILL